MSVIRVNNFCDSIQKIRLFDSRAQYPDYDLSVFDQFSFQVFEPGFNLPILEIDQNSISTSAEILGYPENTINVKITVENLKTLLPNPYHSDKIREYRLFAVDADGLKILLKQDCFYVEDNLTGR